MPGYDDHMGPGTETMSEGMHETPGGGDEGESPGAGQENSLFLTPDMLPPGMKVDAGDILEFKVLNPSDADGHIEVVYNTGEGAGAKKADTGPDWENDFRKEMSAQTGGEPEEPAA